MAGDWIRYANQGATRNLPLNSRLVEAFRFLPELGLAMEVFSGGQPAKGTSGRRVGSTRHDHGNAADVFFTRGGQRLDWANPEHLPLFTEIVSRARAAGVTGFGAGPGYMQPGSMHVGFGAPGVWGAGGRAANAPDWLRAAYEGASAPAAVLATPATSADQQQSAGASTLGPDIAVTNQLGENAPMPQQVFGDIVAPRPPASFANIIDSYAQQRRTAEEEHQERQARLAALFAQLPV